MSGLNLNLESSYLSLPDCWNHRHADHEWKRTEPLPFNPNPKSFNLCKTLNMRGKEKLHSVLILKNHKAWRRKSWAHFPKVPDKATICLHFPACAFPKQATRCGKDLTLKPQQPHIPTNTVLWGCGSQPDTVLAGCTHDGEASACTSTQVLADMAQEGANVQENFKQLRIRT